MEAMQLTRYFALIFGIVYLLIGAVGFIPGMHTMAPMTAPHMDQTSDYGYLFGYFPINALHDVVHVLVGLGGLLAFVRFSWARIYCILLFLIFGILTVMGFIPTLDTTWGWIPLFSGDTWLHAGTSLLGAIFGFVVPEPVHVDPAPAPAAHH
jgi:hypothetical protein